MVKTTFNTEILGSLHQIHKVYRNVQLSTSLGFLVEDTPPVLYAFGHKLIPNTTKDIVLAQTYHCNSRKCRDHTVETVEKDGVLCKITLRSATGSTKFNRSIFSYDSQANDNLPFLNNECTSAYMILNNNVYKHLLKKNSHFGD